MLLFRPFLHFDIIGPGLSTRAVCLEAAQAISRLTSSFSRLFTLRHVPCFLPSLVLAATLTQVSPELLPALQSLHPLVRQRVGANEQLKLSRPVTVAPFWEVSTLYSDSVSALVMGTSQLADMSECHPLAADGLLVLADLRATLRVEVLQ